MAKPTTIVGSNVYIALETSTAGTYARPCGLTSHTITFTKNTTDVTVPDCDDLEAPAWIERGVESLEMSGSGNGILAMEAEHTWWNAFESTESVNARIYLGAPSSAGTVYYAGKIHVTSYEPTGERGGKAQATISFVSDGEMTRTVVAGP